MSEITPEQACSSSLIKVENQSIKFDGGTHYHQLRSTIAQVNGKKELTGRTDLDVDICNQCGRLIANVVIAYNSMLLSGLLSRYLASGNDKALDLLRRISPAAWQHLHFLGHYAFRDKRNPIDLEAVLEGIDWV